jgi:transmembrane sensor
VTDADTTGTSDPADAHTRKQREIRAQAAVWVTDLHGPDRSPELEAGVRRWLAEDPRHAQAFELATDAWQSSGNLPLSFLASVTTTQAPRTIARTRTRYALAGAAALGLTLAGTFFALTDPTLTTGAAEEKTVDLADGSQVTLNANTRVSVDYTATARKLTLAKGEALFTAAHDTTRLFTVIVGNRKVLSLGTIFDIRREDPKRDDFSVTLIDGRIAIADLGARPFNDSPPTDATHATQLQPGQRLHIASRKPDALDTPPIDKVTAWQRGQLIFDDTSLRDAAAEFNRYGKRKLTIDPTVSSTIHVGGVFRLSDPRSFAQAMANAHQLRITETANEINLTAR